MQILGQMNANKSEEVVAKYTLNTNASGKSVKAGAYKQSHALR